MFRFLFVFLLAIPMMLEARHLSITGTIVSNNQKMIGARYMGYVKKINFDIGDTVKREDTLFELESAEFDIMKEQADLGLEQAEIMVNMYRTRMERIKKERSILRKLKKKGGRAMPDLDDMDSVADNVEAGLAAAQKMVENMSVKVKQIATISDYLEVKAPNDGIIVQKRIRVGDLVMPGMLAMLIVDLKHLEIDAQIAESDLLKIHKGQKVDITIPSLKHHTTGVVKTIVPSANPMAHTFTLIVKFKKDNEKIFPGMYAKMKINYESDHKKEE